jgi:hypothetical protein
MKEKLRYADTPEEARRLVETEGPGLVWEVEFAESEAVKALRIPAHHLKTVARLVSGGMIDDPRWPTYCVQTGWEWEGTPLALVLAKEPPSVHVLFKTEAEVEEDTKEV